MIKRLNVLCVGLLCGALSLAHADEAAKTVKIEQMFAAAKIDQMLTQMLSMMSDQMRSAAFERTFAGQLPPEQQKLATDLEQKIVELTTQMISWDVLKPSYVQLYAKTFTEDEIEGMLAFYKSPAGQAMVAKTPQLMTDANQIVQQRTVSIQPQIQAIITEYVEKVKAAAAAKQ